VAESRISRSRFVCTNCGSIFGADVIAAKNILKQGISPTGGLPGMAPESSQTTDRKQERDTRKDGSAALRAERSHSVRWKWRRFSRSTQAIARSAVLLSALPYNVTRTENPARVLSRMIWMPPIVSHPGHWRTSSRHIFLSTP